MAQKVSDLKSITLKIASPEDILSWSFGEVTKPETINYRTQKPEKDGLFCERIFGPEKDYECYCGKYRRVRYKGVVCDKCGVEVTRSSVRRERMGHIKLATPVAHIWFLRGVPSRMATLLGVSVQKLQKVVYYANYIVLSVDNEKRDDAIRRVEEEYNRKSKDKKNKDKKKKEKLKELRDKELSRLRNLYPLAILNEYDYHDMSLKYGEIFEASTGSEPVRKILEETNLDKLVKELTKKLKEEKLSAIKKKKLHRRLILAQRMNKADIKPEWMFLTFLPVMPPELRPMVQLDGGRYASSDLNDLYRRVINRNNRLKRLIELNAPEVIVRNERRMLQEAVDSLMDNSSRGGKTVVTSTAGGRRALKSIADMLKGKQGRFRQNLLGKRVDYSGRSVIVVGPNLDLGQCGLPKKMALELFRPFVIQRIIEEELAYNVRSANHLIDDAPPEVWAILEEVIQGKYVLLNRAPTLHRLGIQAFQPVLIEGNAIQLHPLVCAAYNADFDGDQMAVHLPLSDEAQEEAKTLMLSTQNLTKPATGAPIVNPTLDMVLGCYWLSKIKEGEKGEGDVYGSLDEVDLAHNSGLVSLKAKVKVRVNPENPKFKQVAEGENYIETSPGRIIFNNALPEDFPFVNEDLTSKVLKSTIGSILDKYERDETVKVLDEIKNMGFLYSTLSGTTWAMSDLHIPEEKTKILKEARDKVSEIHDQFDEGLLSVQERRNKVIEVWAHAKNEISKLIPQQLDPHGSVALIVESGAKGSWAQPVQMMGMKGSVVNPAGQVIEMPIESSYKEGFTALEYFISTHGARKGTADTALRTASAGYLTRRLVDVTQDLIVRSEKCDDKDGITISRKDTKETGQTFQDKIYSRVAASTIKNSDGDILVKTNSVIDQKLAGEIDKDEKIEEVQVFSPLTCKDESICSRCYGVDLGRGGIIEMGEAVGVVAAQAIGEPGTQLTMRTFHTGGVAGASDITQGLPRVEEVFEVRTPKGKAIISEVEGKIEEIVDNDNHRVIRIRTSNNAKTKNKKTKSKTKDLKEYKAPLNLALWVEKGDLVVPGTQLTEGHIDLKELYKQVGKDETQKYIIKEVQKVYTSQGATVHDKHVEIVARQMLSRVKVADPGDSELSHGEIVSYAKFQAINENLANGKKEEAKGNTLILGITKVALTTDSFLSAASFQETARVLIRAAVEGRKDDLKGLKENVIIGKMIPAGTGFKE
ncbi:MAG: DNA-directed RNA polymerase subunit beta' [Candidatus Spechtbacterales bacterium]|nr:DNA-directed RNA polymerase subunit beta' [Candidatus Spechtbacterales bacterium]